MEAFEAERQRVRIAWQVGAMEERATQAQERLSYSCSQWSALNLHLLFFSMFQLITTTKFISNHSTARAFMLALA